MMNDTQFLQRVEKIKSRLYKIAYSYFYSDSMAVDAVDETVYKGWLKKKTLKEESFFETWMTQILLNVCRNTYGKYKRQMGWEEIPEDVADDTDAFTNIPLKEAISKLPEKYRQVVILKYFAGYTVAETAEITGEAQGTVATRLRKALQLLRVELTE